MKPQPLSILRPGPACVRLVSHMPTFVAKTWKEVRDLELPGARETWEGAFGGKNVCLIKTRPANHLLIPAHADELKHHLC